jgi:VIT1/CCC1 family predicted Fe2+/Mn2+ transporter/bacterioferritin (cytochrome b1)
MTMAGKEKVITALRAAWQREVEAARLYRLLAEQQHDERRRQLLLRLAHAEEEHAQRFAGRILALGGVPPSESLEPTAAQRFLVQTLGVEAMLRRIEAEEQRNARLFAHHAQALQEDAESHALFRQIEDEEEQHTRLLQQLKPREEPRTRLEAILKGERWHASTGGWIGDAIYGLNDGLGAVFGVVSGMAGAAGGKRVVLVAGLIAMLASALSMGASAFMAAKSEREVYQAELDREKQEIEQSPEHEKEELALIYQLKGFSEQEAVAMTERLASQPEQFLKTMAQEELGLSEARFPNPFVAALTATTSTAIGGFIPVIPFLFTHGNAAVLWAAFIGMAAHFAVGAAKSMVTARSWWKSGLEMTFIAVLCGVTTYALGRLFHIG